MRIVFPFLLALVMAPLSTASAQDGAATSLKEDAAVSTAAADLKTMHAGLIEAKELEFVTKFNRADPVLGTQTGTVHYSIRKPNEVRVDVKRAGGNRLVVSDGQSVFIDAGHGDTRIEKSKDNILANLYMSSALIGVPVWLVDFFWSIDYLDAVGDRALIAPIPAIELRGKTCDGYKIKYGDDDWSVWLERSTLRRPCRVVSRRLDGNALTVQTNDLEWKTPAFTEATFKIPKE